MCSFMEFASMSGPYADLRDVTRRATVSRKSAGGTVAFFIVTRSYTTSRHAHKDVTHAVQYPLSSESSAEKPGTEAEAASGAEAEAACDAEQLKYWASKFDLLAFAWNILRRFIWMLRGQIHLSRNASTSV